ncbi:MAG: PLP-dependent aminotransferase family protein [Candidatus Melainabacteria bacterium]|nr:PLP-dependent aminotransferase family protein [Candidatus Melainabacteria bacterium]
MDSQHKATTQVNHHTLIFVSKLGVMVPTDQGLLHRNLFEKIRSLIVSLQLVPGELLPSTRELAMALKVSRKTVARAYDDLTSQGYIHSKSGIGTFVRRIPPEIADAQRTSDHPVMVYPLSKFGESLTPTISVEPTHQGELPQLHFGAAPVEQLPLASWRKTLLKILRELDFKAIDYDTDPFGCYPLRQAIATYLWRSRSLRCEPEQVIVFSNALGHLRLLSRMLVDAGTPVAVENPGFPFARRVFGALGADLIPIDVDEQGIRVDALRSLESPIRIVYVTPSHQDPTGVVLSLSRRQELIDWARESRCLIIEDDYDCEFLHTGSRVPSLAALDKSQNVVYLGDFWKTLFPIVNVSYMVLPTALVNAFQQVQSLSWTKENTNLPMLESLCLSEFIDVGDYESLIKRTREIYARRYRNLVASITRNFGAYMRLGRESGGMQVLLRTSVPQSDSVILSAAAEAGLALIPTQIYYFERRVEKEFLLSFVLHEESQMTGCIEAWAKNLAVKNLHV